MVVSIDSYSFVDKINNVTLRIIDNYHYLIQLAKLKNVPGVKKKKKKNSVLE